MKLSVVLTFAIPHDDVGEYVRLPQVTKDRVDWLLGVMKVIAAAGKGKVALCERIADAAGLSRNTIYNLWKSYRDSGDWRVLIDKRRTSEFWLRDETKRVGLPQEFIDDWKQRCEDNNRAFKPAWRLLIADWRAWRNGDVTKAIAGYTRPPEPGPNSRIPRGWNYSNLLNHIPNDVELAANRRGRTAALKLLPGIRSTRAGAFEAGLAGPFRDIEFDDMWHDFEVNTPGQRAACRLLEFGAVDAFTTYIFSPGLKPRIHNMETGRMQALNERDFLLYVINWLLDYGVHPLGTVFHVENGTARISKAIADKLMMWLPQLRIEASGMSGAPAFPGAYSERAKGNPNAKPIKEGLGKLIHNQTAHLPGQVGMNRDHLPAEHEGRSRENATLLAICAQMPALRDKLKFGFLDLSEAVFAINDLYGLLNCRDDHQIEGWADCGGVVDMFRFSSKSDDWRPLSEVARLPENDQLALSVALKMDPTLKDRRVLSPAQMLLAHDIRLIRLPDAAVPDLLGAKYGYEKDVVNSRVKLNVPGLGTMRFRAVYQDADGFRRSIPNGSKVLAHLNPWKPGHIYLTDPSNGRYLGKAERIHDHMRGDTDAIHAAHAKAQADYKEQLHNLVQRHGLQRIPYIKANTAALRIASKPTARDQALAAGDFDSSTMLDDYDADESAAVESATYFDPADLL